MVCVIRKQSCKIVYVILDFVPLGSYIYNIIKKKKMKTKLETLELELLNALAEGQKCQERIDDYAGYIKSFQRLKDNLYQESCSIRSRVREKNEEITLLNLPYSKGDRYKIVDCQAPFNEIKIERIEVDNWNYPKSQTKVRFYLRGKFKSTGKWRDIDNMCLDGFKEIITEKVIK